MKLTESWRLSKKPYREVVYRSLAEEKGRMWWGAFGHNRPSKDNQNDIELANRALRIAKFDKVIVSIFNIIICLAPFMMPLFGAATFGLASSISLSLAVSFGLTMLYAIQTLSSFVSAESSALLSVLPMSQKDTARITLFSFIRSVDYMVFGSALSQIVAVAFVTRSPFATVIIFAVAVMNELFAVAAALWFSRVFQKNLLQGGKTRTNAVLRLVFILMWSLLLVGVGLLFSIPWYIMPNLENTLLGISQIPNMLISFLYPFATGIIIAGITYSNVALSNVLMSSIVLVGYGLLVGLASRWSLKIVKSISQGSQMRISRIAAKDFSVNIHQPLLGYVLKDVKVASRNPATAFFFALPVLESVVITLLVSNLHVLRTTAILVATSMGAIFALLIPLALLTSEGKGLEYTKTLPISSRKIVVSKTVVATVTYALVPLALLVLSLIKQLTSPLAILIPFLIIMAVASASVFEVKLFFRTTTKGLGAIVNDLQKLGVGIMTILIPQVAYGIVFLLSLNHIISLLVMGAAALAELAIAMYLLKRR